jgi:DNA-binding transcriptional LysR family regulator
MYNPQLKTFFTVIESGSFSKAAAELYLTPSAVLHQIRALEKDLGVELFLRTSKGVTLTPAGEYLEAHGHSFIRMGDELRAGMPAEEATAFTELSMGMSEDWREAINEGATIVRIGRAIFSETFYRGVERGDGFGR